jgi:hypothetical protein
VTYQTDKRGSIHMKFSMITQENVDYLIEVTACAGLTVYSKSILSWLGPFAPKDFKLFGFEHS